MVQQHSVLSHCWFVLICGTIKLAKNKIRLRSGSGDELVTSLAARSCHLTDHPYCNCHQISGSGYQRCPSSAKSREKVVFPLSHCCRSAPSLIYDEPAVSAQSHFHIFLTLDEIHWPEKVGRWAGKLCSSVGSSKEMVWPSETLTSGIGAEMTLSIFISLVSSKLGVKQVSLFWAC